MTQHKFTILDVETTGFFAGGTDRIVEIALITMDFEGNILGEYETLLNPERDLGPTDIHQITGAMVQHAPRFADIVGDLAEFLAGTIVVGHNVSFDYRFLVGEFQRAGYSMPEIPSICTLKLAREVKPELLSHKLGVVCEHYQIPLGNAHSAYADCEATAKLFRILAEKYGLHKLAETLTIPPGREAWPDLAKTNLCFKRSYYEELPKENYIGQLMACLPECSEMAAGGETEYLKLLTEVLADRKITLAEYHHLQGLAMDYDLSREMVVELHQQYLAELIRIALLDGVISDYEMADLQRVAEMLNIAEQELDEMIAETGHSGEPLVSCDLLKGKTVCFTGRLRSSYQDLPITRSVAQQLARENGMIVKSSVTKGLDYLVAADTDSMSTKARKARTYEIRILAEQVFWSMLRVPVS